MGKVGTLEENQERLRGSKEGFGEEGLERGKGWGVLGGGWSNWTQKIKEEIQGKSYVQLDWGILVGNWGRMGVAGSEGFREG